MASKKGLCVYCESSDINDRIFPVNSEAEVCYCPHCMHKQVPSAAIEAFDKMISLKIEEARNYLYKYSEFNNAYNLFAEVLEIVPNEPRALLGRILSLFVLSTVRKSQITNCNILLVNESNYFHKSDFKNTYLSFLKEFNKVSELYIKRLYSRLSLKKYFFDAECIQLYILRTREIILLKSSILSEATFLIEKFDLNKAKELKIQIEKENLELEEQIKSDYISADGYQYKLISFDPNGVALLSKAETKLNNKVYRYRYSTLDVHPSSDKISISDKIFNDYTNLNKLLKVVLPFALFSLFVSIAFLILSIAIKPSVKFWSVFPVVSSSSFIIFILLLLSHFLTKKKVKLG